MRSITNTMLFLATLAIMFLFTYIVYGDEFLLVDGEQSVYLNGEIEGMIGWQNYYSVINMSENDTSRTFLISMNVKRIIIEKDEMVLQFSGYRHMYARIKNLYAIEGTLKTGKIFMYHTMKK